MTWSSWGKLAWPQLGTGLGGVVCIVSALLVMTADGNTSQDRTEWVRRTARCVLLASLSQLPPTEVNLLAGEAFLSDEGGMTLDDAPLINSSLFSQNASRTLLSGQWSAEELMAKCKTALQHELDYGCRESRGQDKYGRSVFLIETTQLHRSEFLPPVKRGSVIVTQFVIGYQLAYDAKEVDVLYILPLIEFNHPRQNDLWTRIPLDESVDLALASLSDLERRIVE